MQSAALQKPLPRTGQFLICCPVKDQNAILFRQGIPRFQGWAHMHRDAALFPKDLCHMGVPYRLKGVLSKHTLCYGHSLDQVDTPLGCPPHLGVGGQKRQLLLAAGPQQRGQFRADIAPQGGIRLFVDILHA